MRGMAAVVRLAGLRGHWALWAVCAFALLVGALVFDDYHGSYDAPHQRPIAKAALDYLAGDGERAFDQVTDPPSLYYGAAFEAPLMLVERFFGLEGRSIYLSRNILTHLFFLAGGVFCYLLALRMFHSRWLALVALVLYLLHPRIYAHSFSSPKDIPFLAAFMIALYLIHRAFRRDTLGAFLLCGASVGLIVNLRIMGVLLFVAVLVLRALDLAFASSREERMRVLLTGAGFALAAMLTYHASLPVLWTDPVGRFMDLARTLGKHPHEAFSLFRGEWLYSLDGPPWDYVPVWVGITTPPATLLLALAGGVALAWRALRRPVHALRDGPLRFGLLLLALPVATMAAVVVLESNIFGGWHHLYFLYAPLLLLAVWGVHRLASSPRGRWAGVGAYALLGAAMAVTVVSMVRIHPFQHAYFSLLTDRTTPERLVARYEVDYFKFFGRAALAGIAEAHPSGPVYLSLVLNDLIHEPKFFNPDERKRFIGARDFRSGERNFLQLRAGRPCPADGVYVVRFYASTHHCMVDPVAWLGERRREALAREILLRAAYDIHRDGRRLTYLRDGCPREDVGGTRLFLHVVPRDAGDLPPWSRKHGFDNLDRFLRGGTARIDGDCVGVVDLPDYPIAAIRTGQLTDAGILWEASISIGDGAPDYAIARRDALAGEPLARSVYDVHLAGRALTYLRDGCTEAEANARFFLHVVPAEDGDLPEHRREYGFDNLDFTLAARGARLDGNCVALARLPDYPIAAIHTGQYDGTGRLWTAEFALPGGE